MEGRDQAHRRVGLARDEGDDAAVRRPRGRYGTARRLGCNEQRCRTRSEREKDGRGTGGLYEYVGTVRRPAEDPREGERTGDPLKAAPVDPNHVDGSPSCPAADECHPLPIWRDHRVRVLGRAPTQIGPVAVQIKAIDLARDCRRPVAGATGCSRKRTADSHQEDDTTQAAAQSMHSTIIGGEQVHGVTEQNGVHSFEDPRDPSRRPVAGLRQRSGTQSEGEDW